MQNHSTTAPTSSMTNPALSELLPRPDSDAHLYTIHSYPAGLPILLHLVGGIQIVLGLFYLFAPDFFLQQMGHSAVARDLHYPLAMLAARFIVYGFGFIFAARAPERHRLWLMNMVFIQLIDLAAGLFYTANGTVSLTLSGFPMFNALWIAGLLWLWHPRAPE